MKPEEKNITLETMLNSGQVAITDIETRDLITYFRVNGELFCTAGHYCHHKSDWGFDGPFIRMWVKRHKDPEAMIHDAQELDEILECSNLYLKHQASYCKIVIAQALLIMAKRGEAAFVKYLDEHLDATGPKNGSKGEKLLKMLEGNVKNQ